MAGKPPGPWRVTPVAPGATTEERTIFESQFAGLLQGWVAARAGTVTEFWDATPCDVAAVVRADAYDYDDGGSTGSGSAQRRNLRKRMAAYRAQEQTKEEQS